MNVRGTRLGLINFCEGEDDTGATERRPGTAGWELARVAQAIHETKPLVDLIIIVFHGGREYLPVPPPYVVRCLRSLAEIGADAVIAHHPHVPQGFEIHRGSPIFYSLGNFVFHQPVAVAMRKLGYLVTLHVSKGSLEGFEVIPFRLNSGGLKRLAEPHRSAFFKMLRSLSRPLARMEDLQAVWEASLELDAERVVGEMTALFTGAEPVDVRARLAKIRNRLCTPAHRESLIDELTAQIARGSPPRSGLAWARSLVSDCLHSERFPWEHPPGPRVP